MRYIGLVMLMFLGFGFLMFLGLYDHVIGRNSLIIGVLAACSIMFIEYKGSRGDENDEEQEEDLWLVGQMATIAMILLTIGLAPLGGDNAFCRVSDSEIINKNEIVGSNLSTGKIYWESKDDIETNYYFSAECKESPWSFQSTLAMIIRLIFLGVPAIFITMVIKQ